MRFVVLIIGGIATVLMLGISVRLNFVFGASLGQSAEKAQVFGWVSVVADCWKATGPVCIYALARSHRWPAAAAASTLWLACFLYAVSSALGLAVQDRATLTGGREIVRAGYEEARGEFEQKQKRLRQLPAHRSPAEIQAAIAALLARPVVTKDRVRGTVGSLSLQCSKLDARTAETCAQVAELQQERTVADEASRLDQDIAETLQRVSQLRERGGTLSSDPQAELLSRLSMGRVAAKDIGVGLVVLLAAVVELVSAFGPVVLSAFAEVTHKQRHAIPSSTTVAATERDMSRLDVAGRDTARLIAEPATGAVIAYMADRMVPGPATRSMKIDEIFDDYQSWCEQSGHAALSKTDFVKEFDRDRHEHRLADKIQKFGTRYYGIRLVAKGTPRIASRRSAG